MSISYLPSLKDREGNVIIGLMGQFDDRDEALNKKIGDGIFWIPFGLTPGEIVEYDSETGLPNFPMEFMKWECAIISGPKFDEAMADPKRNGSS